MIPSPRVRGLGWLLAASLPLSAAFAQNRYELRSVIAARGGHPVREAASDAGWPRIIYSTTTAGPALAASIGTTLELEITVGSEVPTAEPSVTCSWQIESAPLPDLSCRQTGQGPLRGESAFHGWQGSLPVPVPGTTGIYDLTLECRIQGWATEKIRRRLFVTWAEPLFVVSPPQRAWYEKACCWGGGFSAGATEADILKAMLKGIRGYGQRHWRYGYATRSKPGEYLFTGPGDEQHLIRTDQVKSCGGGSYCKCPWRSLVTTGSPCNFADCYTFSDTFLHIAATLGVGGLLSCRECTVMGEEAAGFFTSPGASSLDDHFQHDIICGDADPNCPAYFFSSHSLLRRDRTYYDATFNMIYSNPSDPVWASASTKTSEGLFIEGELAYVRYDEEHYGNWNFYRKFMESATLELGDAAVEITGNVCFRKMDSDGGGIAEALEVGIEMKILRDGMHAVHGRLYKNEVLISQRPDWGIPHPAKFMLIGERGDTVEVKLRFSGEEIYLSKEAGPWEVAVYFAGRPEEFKIPTPPYRYQEFGERDGWLKEPVIEWVEAEESASVRVEVPLAVREPDTFIVQLNLAQGGRTIANVGARCEGFCPQPLVLEAPVGAAAESELPYFLSLGLFQGAELSSIVGIWRQVPAHSR